MNSRLFILFIVIELHSLIVTTMAHYYANPVMPSYRYCVPRYIEKKFILHKPIIKKVPIIKEVIRRVYVPVRVPVKVYEPSTKSAVEDTTKEDKNKNFKPHIVHQHFYPKEHESMEDDYEDDKFHKPTKYYTEAQVKELLRKNLREMSKHSFDSDDENELVDEGARYDSPARRLTQPKPNRAGDDYSDKKDDRSLADRITYNKFEESLTRFILENVETLSSWVSMRSMSQCMLQCAANLFTDSQQQNSATISEPQSWTMTPPPRPAYIFVSNQVNATTPSPMIEWIPHQIPKRYLTQTPSIGNGLVGGVFYNQPYSMIPSITFTTTTTPSPPVYGVTSNLSKVKVRKSLRRLMEDMDSILRNNTNRGRTGQNRL